MLHRYAKSWRGATAAAGLMACMGLALASDKSAPEDASQAQATPAYKSVFADYRVAAEEKETPAQLWRWANDEMGRLQGHAGQLKEASVAPPADAHSAHHSPASKDKK